MPKEFQQGLGHTLDCGYIRRSTEDSVGTWMWDDIHAGLPSCFGFGMERWPGLLWGGSLGTLDLSWLQNKLGCPGSFVQAFLRVSKNQGVYWDPNWYELLLQGRLQKGPQQPFRALDCTASHDASLEFLWLELYRLNHRDFRAGIRPLTAYAYFDAHGT